MDAIRQQLSKPLVAGILGLVVGALLGLVVLGWWLFPVKWVNATPADLSYPEKVEYLRMAMEAFSQNASVEQARIRYQALGEDAEDALQEVVSNPQGLSPESITAFNTMVVGAADAGMTQTPGAEAGLLPTTTPPGAEAGTGAEGGAGSRTLLITGLCVVGLLVLGALAAYLLRGRSAYTSNRRTTPSISSIPAEPSAGQTAWTDYSSAGAEQPLAQFLAEYKLGDDLFDDSFSIESQAGGEFLGECGVGISETIGVGDPKKVTAFEVWLFDKNDIQTVTKVLMSTHAFEDDAIRQRLTAKGEPVQVQPGNVIELNTETLHLVARVVDMAYGEGALPSESFFNRFLLELVVWSKA